MCGILGQLTFNNRFISSFPPLDLLKHRGPDGKGEWTNAQSNVYLGHTRLAILEPTLAGYQPMPDATKRFMITFNGEIYNHLELRLLLPDVDWKGTSDTETLVELLAAMGIETLRLLKGMFAFALYDDSDGSILLVRDRFGIKPLWLRKHEDAYSFASEVRALFLPGEFKPVSKALSEYIGFGRMPAHGEVFEGMEEVPPGSWIKLQGKGGVEKGKWWPVGPFATSKAPRRQDYVQRINQLLSSSIEEHLISDVGIGAFLSGGIDSSIVALVAGKILGRNLRTFTVGFPQKGFDERLIAGQVAKKAGSEHYEVEVNEETCLSWVREAVMKLDLPSVDAINTYIVSKAVRATGLKVALSGLGGDELFGGYPSFRQVPLLTFLGLFPGLSRQLIHLMPKNLKEKLSGIPGFTATELAVSRRRFTSVASLKAMGLTDGMPVIPPPPGPLNSMSRISWAEIQGYMIPMLLRDSDQMSMAVGLEIRVPFLDHQLVEEVMCIPRNYKNGRGVKPLLVEAFQVELPPEVYTRPKQGFALPMEIWIREPLSGFTKEGVLAAADLLGLSEPLRQRDEFQRGRLHWTRVWKWCVLGHFLAKQKADSMHCLSLA